MGCLLGKTILCEEEDGARSVERVSHEHCGIVVPGQLTDKGVENDPSNLCLLEATSGSGITCRPSPYTIRNVEVSLCHITPIIMSRRTTLRSRIRRRRRIERKNNIP